MKIPPSLLSSLEQLPGFNETSFLDVHESGKQVTSVRVNPGKIPSESTGGLLSLIPSVQSGIPWTDFGYYLSERPSFTFDPLFHAGCYYVQEASSMFLEHVLKQTVNLETPLKVLDLCAAPGGKSTHILSLLSEDSFLVSNEVIRTRVNVLKDNIIKWGNPNVIVTNNDPQDFSKLEGYFDVIVIDAPCSGSGLFRRDPSAIEEWSENNVELCSHRQQRILADAWPALKTNGIIIYSTCSYSKQEDENICSWAKSDLGAEIISLDVPSNWGIIPSGGGYRFWPDKVEGEGFFISCFQKNNETDEVDVRIKKQPAAVAKNDLVYINDWISPGDWEFIRHNETVYAWPKHAATDFTFILQELRVIYSGIRAGELMRNKLIPDHALAMSAFTSNNIKRIEVNLPDAIAYLQRKDLHFPKEKTGWQLISYDGYNLGWVNILSSRTNNYYPKELRILKDK